MPRDIPGRRWAVLATLTILLATSCGGPDGRTSGAASPAPASAQSLPAPPTDDDRPTATDERRSMDIRVAIGGTSLRGSLDDTAAGRDLASLLPLTLTLTDFASTEKISDLPRKLSTSGAPDGTAARAGDLAYYAPWGNLAIFYRDSPYATGLVRLGSLESGIEELIGRNGDFTVTIQAIDGNN
jgi:hypothetical protein